MKCECCAAPAKFTALYSGLGEIALCSNECNEKFYIGCGKSGTPFPLTQIKINALIVEVVDWQTINVLHIPFGGAVVEYRIANSLDEPKHYELMKRMFAASRQDTETMYPIASIIPVGVDASGRMLANVYLPQNCAYCFKSLVAHFTSPDAKIIELGPLTSFEQCDRWNRTNLSVIEHYASSNAQLADTFDQLRV